MTVSASIGANGDQAVVDLYDIKVGSNIESGLSVPEFIAGDNGVWRSGSGVKILIHEVSISSTNFNEDGLEPNEAKSSGDISFEDELSIDTAR